MELDEGWVAILGTTLGAVLYAGAEVIRRIRNNGPKNDPVIVKMQAQLDALHEGQVAAMKIATAVAAQLDGFIQDHHEVERRVATIERNGKSR